MELLKKRARPGEPGRARRPPGETDPAAQGAPQPSLQNWPFPRTLLDYSRPVPPPDLTDEPALF